MATPSYRVFGLDRQIYGPVSGDALREWVQAGRVLRDTWIHAEGADTWRRAEDVSDVESVFPPEATDPSAVVSPAECRRGVAPKTLTRLRLFADMSPEDLEPFAREMEEQTFRAFSYVVRQGSAGDAMYFVMQGRVGISTKGQVAEAFLTTLNVGEAFGEMALFDPAPRSADARAETDVIVLRLSAEALQTVCRENPTAGNKFLWNAARLLSARIRAMDRRAATAKDMDTAGKKTS